VYGHIEELKNDSKKARVCTPDWSFTVIASIPAKGITIKIKPKVILRQQLATQADGFLEIIDGSLNPVPGGRMIMREQVAAGVCYLCAKRGHISVNSPGLKLGGPQNKAECTGSCYRSNVNMQNLPKLYEIRNRKKPILDAGAMMHQQAGTGIWHCNTLWNTQKQQHKKAARNKRNRNWPNSRHNHVEAVDQLFGANKVEVKQKTLEAHRFLMQADQAPDEVCEYFDNLTKDV
jgi:hypothetical protein